MSEAYEETYDAAAASAAQKKYCEEHGYPVFAPLYSSPSFPGTCYKCHNNIYQANGGYSVELAGSGLITGCPFCHYSFCE